jgi:hypothetical protein
MIDFSGAAVGIAFPHERVHTGNAFIASYKTPDASPLADNETVEFLVITGDKLSHLSFQTGGNNDLELIFFEGTTVSNNGTSMAAVGLNRNRSLPSNPQIWRDPTITADGNQLMTEFTSWSTGLPLPRDNVEWILAKNTSYLIRVINRAGANQPVSLVTSWYQTG